MARQAVINASNVVVAVIDVSGFDYQPPAGCTTVAVPDGMIVEAGASYDPETGAFTDPVPTAAQQAQATYAALLADGLTIDSTGTPTVNGTYALDDTQQAAITEVSAYIGKNNAFPGGLTSVVLRTVSGSEIAIPTITLWYAISTAIADFIAKADAALLSAENGGTWTAPSNTVTIP
jgi:hypothetical protein